jgi:hypothetical protein
VLTAPAAMAAAALSYALSALRLRHVAAHTELRALALTAATVNFGIQLVNSMLPILFVRQLRLPASALGLFWAAGGAGLLLGARLARRLAARLGAGRVLAVVGAATAPAGLIVPLAGHGLWVWAAGLAWCVAMVKVGVDNVVGVSLRQSATPAPLLGRMNATFRFVATGALALGSVAAGVLGECVGVRAAVWTGGCFVAVSFVPVFCSPLRRRVVAASGRPSAGGTPCS